MFMHHFLSALFLLVCLSCTSDTPDCSAGQPVAIFAGAGVPVSAQQFEVNGQTSLESVEFAAERVRLELQQSGCDAVVQDYTFTLPPDHELARGNVAESTGRLFYFLASGGPQLAQYQAFGEAIQAKGDALQADREVELVPGMFIRVNRLVSGDELIQRVRLRQAGPRDL